MQLRIRLDRGAPFQKKRGKNRRLASATAVLLVPLSLMALTLAFWKLAADLEWTSHFGIGDGTFSHWQVWIGIGVAGALVAYRLNRYGRGG